MSRDAGDAMHARFCWQYKEVLLNGQSILASVQSESFIDGSGVRTVFLKDRPLLAPSLPQQERRNDNPCASLVHGSEYEARGVARLGDTSAQGSLWAWTRHVSHDQSHSTIM
jgi:hypothetical protein